MNKYFEQLQAICESNLDDNLKKSVNNYIQIADKNLSYAYEKAFTDAGVIYYGQAFINLVGLRCLIKTGQVVSIGSIGSALYYMRREPGTSAVFDSLNTLLGYVCIPSPEDAYDVSQSTERNVFELPDGALSLLYVCLHIYCMLIFYDLVADIRRVSLTDLILSSINKPADIILSVTVDRFMESIYLYENSCIILEEGYAEYNRYARTLTDNIIRSVQTALAGMLILNDELSESKLTYGELFCYCISNEVLSEEQLNTLKLLLDCDDNKDIVLAPSNKKAINSLFKSIAKETIRMYNDYTVTEEHRQLITQMGEAFTDLFSD